MTQRLVSATAVLLVSVVFASSSAAQSRTPIVDGIEIVTGLMEFDLSGTGTTMPVAIRATMPMTDRLVVEVGATMAAPHQQFGSSTFAAPEARVRYGWRFGAFEPFIGGGGGFSVVRANLGNTRWEPTVTGGGGLKVHLQDHLYIIGEMRLRGISQKLSANTAEWLGGVGWRLW